MRNVKAPIALSVSLLGGAALQAQQGGSLTPGDYAEIQQLYARYAYAVDSVADNGTALAGLFTADGVLADEAGKTYTGRNQLMEMARTRPGKSPTTVRHFVWNVRIDPAPPGATGKAYIAVTKLEETGKPATLIDLGQYWDDLVKTPEGWRIKRREFHRAPAGGREGAPPAQPEPRGLGVG
jgi:hypothetical protein